MVALRSERFRERVLFAGNLEKNDLSITLSDVQQDDEGVYNCYVRNPPDRIQGHGIIMLNVVTERKRTTTHAQHSNIFISPRLQQRLTNYSQERLCD